MTSENTEHEKTEKDKEHFQIQIDRVHYTVNVDTMTGAQLRALVSPPIGSDRDLFEVVPGGTDRKIENNDPVQLRNGLRFFTAPSHINPGSSAR
jgi:Multiubiquitin